MTIKAADISFPDPAITITAVRSQGAGGQNVNKVSSAIHLRFDVRASSLPDGVKERLLNLSDHRITDAGIVVIKAQSHRSREKNLDEALERLREMIGRVSSIPRVRRATAPTRGSQIKRLEGKTRRAQVKTLRGKIAD